MEPNLFYDYKHAPTHLFVPGSVYMLTAGTYNRERLLNTDEKKNNIIRYLNEITNKYDWQTIAWVVLDNHYHTLLRSPDSDASIPISRLCKLFHRKISMSVNRHDGIKGRQVMYNYWDTCITYERSYWARLNYINHNPVKHGYVDYAEDYPFSSYYLSNKEQWEEYEEKYPWDLVKELDDF
jgi:putative transposase